MEELKRCPFCGEKAEFFIEDRIPVWITGSIKVGIRCSKCYASIPGNYFETDVFVDDNGDVQSISDGEEKAIEAWNKRYKED